MQRFAKCLRKFWRSRTPFGRFLSGAGELGTPSKTLAEHFRKIKNPADKDFALDVIRHVRPALHAQLTNGKAIF